MKIIGPVPGMFTKFCPPEFNVAKGCNTVRIGTLYDFRTIEDEKLRDVGEGTMSYKITFPELTLVSQEWLSAFEFQGVAKAKVGKMNFSHSGVSIKDVTIGGSGHNCWVYCLSRSSESAGNISETHQDKWFIDQDKLAGFAHYLGALLWESISFSDLPIEITSKYGVHDLAKLLSMEIDYRPIEYKQRILEITQESELPISEIFALEKTMAFIKPGYFEPECELRIAFWLKFDGKLISIQNHPKILTLRPVDSFVSAVPTL